MTRHHPWIERISDRFFEVSFDAALRRMVRRYLKRHGIGRRDFGRALDDVTLAKRLAEGRQVKVNTADKALEFMGEPPLRTLFLEEIDAYLRITATAAYKLGLEALGDPSFVPRLRKGLSPYVSTIDKVRGWMGAHSSREQRRAIGAATLHASWFRLGTGARPGHGRGAAAASLEQRYLSTKQAAKYLGVSAKTLDRLRTDGGGPPYYKLGNSVRYRHEDLDEWAKTRRRLSTSDDGTARATAVK